MRVLGAAYLLGARLLEKHFTFDKTRPGNDHYHAMDAADLRTAMAELRVLQALLGSSEKRVLACEADARRYARRSLVAAGDLPAGHVLGAADVLVKRPGSGIAPGELARVLGRRLVRSIRADQLFAWDDLAPEDRR
jgi:N-acetylneuraminate synthase